METLARAPWWKDVRFFNVAPGAIKTPMTAGDGMPFWLKPIRNLLFKSPADGAARLYRAAMDPPATTPALLVANKVRPMKFELDEAGFRQVVAGLKVPDALIQEAFPAQQSAPA